jgi:hypothetical protein
MRRRLTGDLPRGAVPIMDGMLVRYIEPLDRVHIRRAGRPRLQADSDAPFGDLAYRYEDPSPSLGRRHPPVIHRHWTVRW